MTRTWTPRPGSCGTWPGRGPGRASPDQEGQLRLGRRVGRPTPGRLGREHDPRRCPDRVQRLRRHAHGLGPDPIRGREQRRASVPAAQPGTHPPGPDTRDVTGPVGGAPMMRFMARPGRRRQVQRPVHIGVGDRTGTPTRPARQAPDQKKNPSPSTTTFPPAPTEPRPDAHTTQSNPTPPAPRPTPSKPASPTGSGRTQSAPTDSSTTTTGASTPPSCATTAPPGRPSPSQASRRTSPPPARTNSPSSHESSGNPPSDCSTRSAPGKPPKWSWAAWNCAASAW